MANTCYQCGESMERSSAFLVAKLREDEQAIAHDQGVRSFGRIALEAVFCSKKCAGDRRIVTSQEEHDAIHGF